MAAATGKTGFQSSLYAVNAATHSAGRTRLPPSIVLYRIAS